MNELSVYNLKINVYEMIQNEDDIIIRLLDLYLQKDSILKIFNLCCINENYTYDEKYQYFYDLGMQIRRLSKYGYTDDDVVIYAMYASTFKASELRSMDDISNNTKKIEKILSLKPSGDNEVFAQESVKYRLLHLYAEQIANGRYEDMKKLLKQLNETKEKYDELKNKIFNKES